MIYGIPKERQAAFNAGLDCYMPFFRPTVWRKGARVIKCRAEFPRFGGFVVCVARVTKM